jgi:ligand-binding sensor domain-containing protein
MMSNSILIDKSGHLWIGSLNGGVSRYDGKQFIHFTDEQGLSNNEVITIFEDKAAIFGSGPPGV